MLTRVVTFLSGGKPRPDAPPPAPPSGPSSGAGPSSSSSRAGLALALPAYPPAFAPGLGVLSSPLGLPGAYIESGAPAATPRGFFDHAARRAAARAPPPTASPSPAASTARAESPTLHRPTSPLLSLYVSPSGAYVPSSKPDAASTSPYTETPPVLSPSSPSSARSPPTMYTSQPSSSMTFGGAPASMVAENFPLAPPEAPVDMYEDEALTPLEKIYIFSRSEATFHR
jgi:serine/threonine-protein phosphatase 4 regulatory subunit 1